MAKRKRKLTAAERAEKRRRRREYMTIFVNGKQKRVRRPPTIDGMDVDEFIRRNADPIWLHQNEMWELMDPTGEMEEIEQLWREHQAAGFPQHMAGKEIEGEDLVSLDSVTAACISTFIGNSGSLEPEGVRCLTSCHEGLTKVLPRLGGEAAKYYSRLHMIAELALQIVDR